MKKTVSMVALLLALLLSASAFADTFVDAHGNEILIDPTKEAYSYVTLYGANNAARMAETNLGDLWTDALRWFAVSGRINEYFEQDDVTAGMNAVFADADHIVALWNGGNLRADIAEGTFGEETLAQVLPYPNKVAVVYMTGAELAEALEAASQALPYTEETAKAASSFMQVSGMSYTVNVTVPYAAGEAYGDNWFRATQLGRVDILDVCGYAFDKDATYAVITNNANFNGMDSSYIFKEAAAGNEKSTITVAGVREVVFMYISEVLNGQITVDYENAAGRITIMAE